MCGFLEIKTTFGYATFIQHFCMTVSLGARLVGLEQPPLVIAEMSGNHNQSLDRALSIVDAAAEAGAHAFKLQTYTADTMTLDVRGGDFELSDTNSLWSGKNLHELYKLAYTPWEWHEPIMRRARDQGMICFSSPFDETAVDFLEDLDVPAYKIASFENNHLPLIKKAAETGKPLIISTGMASLGELESAVTTAKDAGCTNLILLKCTSTYPATPENTNIRTIPNLRELFGCEIGISDHTHGIGVSLAAVALGASVVEKHFTLCRSDGGVDSAFSLEPAEFKTLVDESMRVWQSLGKVFYGPTEQESKSIVFRRSIYASNDIQEGECFTKDNIRIVRPGYGLQPQYYDKIIGLKSMRFFKKGDPIKLESLL